MRAGTQLFLLLLSFSLSPGSNPGQQQQRIHLPTSKTILNPAPGSPQRTNGFPETIALSPDGRYAALLNNGYGATDSGVKQSIAVIDLQTNQVADFPDDRLAEEAHQSYFIGLAFNSDGTRLYASMGSLSDPTGSQPNGTGNGIAVYRFEQGKISRDRFLKIALQPVSHGVHVARGLGKLPPNRAIPYPAGLAVLSGARKDQLLVANNLSDNVVLLDPDSGQELAHFALGTRRFTPASFPYTVIATRDGRRAWCSLWNASQVVELDLDHKSIVRRISLLLPKSPTAPGSHPTAMLLSPDEQILYVALSNADSVAAINSRTGKVQAYLSTRLPKQEFGGNETDGLAQSQDGKRLFAASAATDSVAVFDTSSLSDGTAHLETPLTALGFIPTEWYTLAVAVAGNDLLIATGKGTGTGPNGVSNVTPAAKSKKEFPYIATLLHGSIARISLHEIDTNLPALTHAAQEQMQLLADSTALPFAPGANPIHHVIYIIKENRTYDQLFGDLKVGDGDPSLTLYGEDITPNQHKLALQFGVLDNFYDSGEVSGDGHMWSNAAIAGDYNEKTWQIAYRGHERTYDFEGMVADESPLEHDEPDVNEPATGYLWGNAARHGLTYRHYGEFVASEWCGEENDAQASPKKGTPSTSGQCARSVIKHGEALESSPGQSKGTPSPYPWPVPVLRRNVATKPELRGHFDPRFADFNVDYPDQLRADEFLREFAAFVAARKEHRQAQELPNYILLRLPNDHTGGTRPGFPTPSASVADNDLAIGRVVDAVSHSPYWDDTAIFIIEDDAQDGADHVDAHRSIALVISKYAAGTPAQPHVEHSFFTTVSLIRTMEAVLGLPPMNHNDAYAPVMSSLFAGSGNQPPFAADFSNLQNGLIFKTNAPTAPGAKESASMDWRHADEADNRVLNSILWRDRKGEVPMPPSQHTIFPAAGDRK